MATDTSSDDPQGNLTETSGNGNEGVELPEVTGSLSSGIGQRLLYGIASWSYPLYSWLLAHRRRFVADIEDRLRAANLSISPEIYLAGALGVGTASGLFIGLGIGLLFLALFAPLPIIVGPDWVPNALYWIFDLWQYVKEPVAALLLITVGVSLGIGSAILSAKYGLWLRIYNRKREINILLPDAIAFMYAQSDGGMDQLELVHAVASSEDTLGTVAEEFQRIEYQMTYFNQDYRTALEQVAEATPSQPLSQFLNDMLSVVNSGGDMTEFLDSQKDQQLDTVQKSQESRLNLIETLGQFFLVAAVAPLFALVLLMLTSMLGSARPGVLAAIVYGVIPLLNLLYLALLSSVKQDELGTGRLEDEKIDTESDTEVSPFDLGLVDTYAQQHSDEPIFKRIRQNELQQRVSEFISQPLSIFRARPVTTLYLTVPLVVLSQLALYGLGVLQPSLADIRANGIGAIPDALLAEPITQTTGWVLLPLFITLLPISVFYELRARHNDQITETLTEELRKMANANESGLTVLEAIKTTCENNPSLLSDELELVVKKVNYGKSLSAGLVEMNNKYERPRLARSVKLIERAQRASNEISDVLKTATRISEIRDDMESEFQTRTQLQVVVMTITFLVVLGVLGFLRAYFVPVINDLVAQSDSSSKFLGGGQSLGTEYVNLIFFHGALIQGMMTGLVVGYLTSEDYYRSIKYVLAFALTAVIGWSLVTVLG